MHGIRSCMRGPVKARALARLRWPNQVRRRGSGRASPGESAWSLAELLGDLPDLGVNVLEVGHERLGPRLHFDEAEVVLAIETRGPGRCEEVIGALSAPGHILAFT